MPDGTATSIQDRIAAVLADGSQPDRVLGPLDSIHKTLTTPTRITLMGPPGVGKSGVMALLAGRNVLGDLTNLGTVKLRYDELETTTLTVLDGNSRTFEGLPDPDIVGMMTPVMTEITAPLPALRKITVTKLAEADDLDGQIKAMTWAAKQTDLAIWCTHKFGGIEQKLWSHMPPAAQDKAIALSTNCDAFDGDRRAASSALASKADRDFAFVIGISLRDAMRAALGAQVDRSAMKASGGMQLISTILKEIDKVEASARDRAEVLLVGAEAVPTSKPAQKVDVPKPVATKPDVPAQQVATNAPKLPKDDAFAEAAKMIDAKAAKPSAAPAKPTATRTFMEPEIFPDFELAPEPAAPAAKAKPAVDPGLPQDAVIVCLGAIERLQKVGQDFEKAEGDSREMLDASVKTLTWLDEHLMEAGKVDHPRYKRLQRMTEDATDLVQLLRLEGDTGAQIEAATLLLQMKRGFQAAVAA